jgi:hypothetical protein
MRSMALTVLLLVTFTLGGCPGSGADVRNPFMTATEEYGKTLSGDTGDNGGSTGQQATAEFRRKMTVTLSNSHPLAELNVSMAAWVYPSSIRSAAQQDELLANGFYRLDEELRLGSVFTLVPGTFVYGGPGLAGATSMRLGRASEVQTTDSQNPDQGSSTITPVERAFELVTPDVLLIFSQPPISCDSIAFYYTVDGDPLTSEGLSAVGDIYAGPTSAFGGLKTLAQIDVYECMPFKPGMYFRQGGGAVATNEYYEGQNIRFDFYQAPTGTGEFCTVTKPTP